MTYLGDNGYSPSINSDGDILFHYDDGNYYIFIEEDDPGFFWVVYPNFWPIESDFERAKVAAAASYASRMTKVAKVYISGSNNNNTSISVEILLRTPEDFKLFFNRILSIIASARNHFVQQMNR
ncbi:MAG: hypothetical protein LBT11_02740 [Treponema sp.]|nr:hypothetical protein [Treponema sp.]